MKSFKTAALLNRIKYFLFKKAYRIFGRNSFSQAGEDMIIDFLLQTINRIKPYYLELGVYDPRNGSNTYKFYVRGARGVLVEADKALIKTIKEQRPNDLVLNVGVSSGTEREATFYVFDEPSVNTFDREEAYSRQEKGPFRILREERVLLKTLNEILRDDCEKLPDLISIDIEGLDYEVLKSWDAQSFPIPIVIAETCLYSPNHRKEKDTRINELMKMKGYFVYADTYINTIFINENWFKNL